MSTAIELEKRITQLIRDRNAMKRRHGTGSDEYFDANENVIAARYALSDFKKLQKDAEKKAQLEAKKAERLATAPVRKLNAQQRAKERREAKKYRKIYNETFAKEQEHWLSGFSTESYAENIGSAGPEPDMVGATPYQYTAVDGHFQGRKFLVHSRVKQIDGGNAQIISDVNKVMKRDVAPRLKGIIKEKRSVKVTPFMLTLMSNVNGSKDQASETFNTPWQSTDILAEGNDVDQWLTDATERMLTRIEEVKPSIRLSQV